MCPGAQKLEGGYIRMFPGTNNWNEGTCGCSPLPIYQEGTNVHFSNVHIVLCQIFGLDHLTPPFHAFFPPLLSIASRLIKVGNQKPKKGPAMQRCHEEQSARSKGARLSPLDQKTGTRAHSPNCPFTKPPFCFLSRQMPATTAMIGAIEDHIFTPTSNPIVPY